MKLAISTQRNGWDSQMDNRYGRAAGFLIVDTGSGETEFLDNSRNRDSAHGAGRSVTQLLIEKGVDGVISGRVGPTAAMMLGKAGIKVWKGNDSRTARRMFEDYWNGTLIEQQID